jgi:hypothetical protein
VTLQADTGKLGDGGLESPINVIVSGRSLRHRNKEGVPSADDQHKIFKVAMGPTKD